MVAAIVMGARWEGAARRVCVVLGGVKGVGVKRRGREKGFRPA